jgi:hypothetical protein
MVLLWQDSDPRFSQSAEQFGQLREVHTYVGPLFRFVPHFGCRLVALYSSEEPS